MRNERGENDKRKKQRSSSSNVPCQLVNVVNKRKQNHMQWEINGRSMKYGPSGILRFVLEVE